MKLWRFIWRIAIPAVVLSLFILGLRFWQNISIPGPAPTSPPAAPSTPQPTSTLLQAPQALPTPPPIPSPKPPALAVRLRIPRLGVDLPIIEGDGVDVPFGKIAHHPATAWPGQGSNAYFYGHARRGSLLELWWAQVGDEIILELADGRSLTYEIEEVLPQVPYNAVQFLDPTPNERLTLQTCTSANPADPRFIVIARPKGESRARPKGESRTGVSATPGLPGSVS